MIVALGAGLTVPIILGYVQFLHVTTGHFRYTCWSQDIEFSTHMLWDCKSRICLGHLPLHIVYNSVIRTWLKTVSKCNAFCKVRHNLMAEFNRHLSNIFRYLLFEWQQLKRYLLKTDKCFAIWITQETEFRNVTDKLTNISLYD